MEQLVRIPDGIYSYQSETNTHSILFHMDTRSFSISSDSMKGLMSLIETMFSPRSDMTVSQWNSSVLGMGEDTQVIELKQVS
jgi:hypothetical protein